MKNNLISLAAAFMVSGTVSAQGLQVRQSQPVQKQISPRTEKATIVKSRILAKGVTEEELMLPNGVRIKNVRGIQTSNNVINPELRVRAKAAEVREGFALYEDFEGWDGTTPNWAPEGWVIDHKDSPASTRGWKMTLPFSTADVISSKCMMYEYFDEEDVFVDEWLISPEVTVGPGMELCWEARPNIYYCKWNYTEHAEKGLTLDDIINDLKVNISTDGGQTWETIFSHAEDWVTRNNGSFFALFNQRMLPYSISLEDFVGKKVKIAFQIDGHGPNDTNFIDNVTIALPLTQTGYSRPMSNLYFGLSDLDLNVPASIMTGPVFSPIRYANTTTTPNYESVWTYTDSEGEKTSTEKHLEVTYKTDHTDASTSRNNWYEFPTLTATSETTAAVTVTYPGYYQAGGKGEYEVTIVDDSGAVQTKELFQFGLTVPDAYTEGTATWADVAVPYFGYNNESDRFWSEDMLGADYVPDDPDNWKHLEKIGNMHYSPASPIVIEGVRLNAYGKINPRGIKMKAEIYFMNQGFMIENSPRYVAECRPEDIFVFDRLSSSDFLSFYFKFDEPVVLSSDITPYFFVAISGFRDPENVDYFSPEMSEISTPTGMALGWGAFEMRWLGQTTPLSWSAVASKLDEFVSFFIMLDAAYPWLETDVETLTLSDENTGTVTFDSFHPGENLTFEGMPEWLTATATGQYDKTQVTFNAKNVPADKPTVTVTVKGHGVSKELTIDTSQTSLDTVITDNVEEPATIYSLDGKMVNGDNLLPGIYVKRQGNTSTKVIVK